MGIKEKWDELLESHDSLEIPRFSPDTKIDWDKKRKKEFPAYEDTGAEGEEVPTLIPVSKREAKEKYKPAKEIESWKMRKILEHEGFRLNPYKDSQGYITGGIGHKFTREDFQEWNPNWPDHKKYEFWMEKFREDYARASRAAIAIMNKHNIEPNETIQYVLTDMVFQMGPVGVGGGVSRNGKQRGGFKNFLKDIREGNIEGAILEMKRKKKESREPSLWYEQTPQRVESLAKVLRSLV